MDLEFTADQQELRAAVRAVLDRECPSALVRGVVEKGEGSAELWGRMIELDWPALTIPEEAGGLGLGYVELAVVAEELGRVIAPGPLLATTAQFAPAVRETGTPEQRSRFLGAVASGRITGALAVAEAAGDWSPGALVATAVADGDAWRLQGTKHFVADGATADEVLVAARLPGSVGADGIGLFVVPGGELRARAVPAPTLDPTQPLATLDLDGVRVPGDRALGRPGEAGTALQRAIEEATVATALMTVGACEAILTMTVEYAKVRRQFGVPIGAFQAVKHKLADLFVAVERARVLAYFAALTIAEDDPRRAVAASMAKAAAGECQHRVVQDGLQLHGGIGYTWEHDLHLYLKRAKAGEGQFGPAAFHRARVADHLGLA
jgi:alkylation response protein AidB-like acyl-CoA dehydrogenase